MNELTRINGIIHDLQQRVDVHKNAKEKPAGYWELVKKLISYQCYAFKLKNKYIIIL